MGLSQLSTTKYKDIPSFTSIIVAFPLGMIDHWHISAYLTLLFGWFCACAKLLQSCPTLCDPMNCSPPGSSLHGDSPGKNTGVGAISLSRGPSPWLTLRHLKICMLGFSVSYAQPRPTWETLTNLGDWKKACMVQSCSAYRSHYAIWYFCLRALKKKNGYVCN